MEFANEFVVPADIETTWRLLTDLEQVAPCLPGATLEEVTGDVYTGRVRVKVGPVTMTYRGTAELTELDRSARKIQIDARGRETRGSGTASADVVVSLRDAGAGTLVHVVTGLAVTGKPAQFGRGVMEDVGTRIVDQFAKRLEALVLDDRQATGTEDVVPAVASARQQVTRDWDRESDNLDLVGVAGVATAKRVLPLLAAFVLGAVILRRMISRH